MVIVELKRRSNYTDDYHVKGSSVVIELSYSELALLDNALTKYDISENEEDKRFFKWQLATIREIVKEGAPTSFIDVLFQKYCRPEQKEGVKNE